MNNNSTKYAELRERYPEFLYEAFHHEWTAEGLLLWFDFRMGDVVFHPEALIEARPFLSRDVPTPVLDRMVFDIGMIELISYWKCACPPTVKVLCGALTDEQTAFWRKLYWNGLGEFFYTNGIAESQECFLQVESGERRVENGERRTESGEWRVENGEWRTESGERRVENGERRTENKTSQTGGSPFSTLHSPLSAYLVPIGGGKDSVVTLELLRRAGKTIRPLIMNPRGATRECARVAGFPLEEVLVIRRKIDPTLLDLNAKGYLNGHTPFSAMLAFYTRLASALSGIPNVALSNESSANESTVRDSYVNHQYSKSLEFEDDFRKYVSRFAEIHKSKQSGFMDYAEGGRPFNYFSFLRPLSELQIAMLFSRFTDYHDVFRSCNVGSKEDIWCGHCAKCLFAYIILSPFIEPARLNQIFGKPMLDDTTLELEFRQLLGLAETKPFECVGTVSEVRQALQMATERWYKNSRPKLLENLEYLGNLESIESLNLRVISPIGNLTEEEFQILQQACTEKNN